MSKTSVCISHHLIFIGAPVLDIIIDIRSNAKFTTQFWQLAVYMASEPILLARPAYVVDLSEPILLARPAYVVDLSEPILLARPAYVVDLVQLLTIIKVGSFTTC